MGKSVQGTNGGLSNTQRAERKGSRWWSSHPNFELLG